MRCIQKATEPRTVTETRAASTTNLSSPLTARTAFDQIDKQAVRSQLAQEQRRLCAFCMCRIDETQMVEGEPRMKIAHRTPIAVDSSTALLWTNLLGSCDGGQRSGGRAWTCDAAQGSNNLQIDPTSAPSIARLSYERVDGREGLFITSSDPQLRADVAGTLRLNSGDLPVLRQRAWKAFQKLCSKAHPKARGKPAWREYFLKWKSNSQTAQPFLGVIEWMMR